MNIKLGLNAFDSASNKVHLSSVYTDMRRHMTKYTANETAVSACRIISF